MIKAVIIVILAILGGYKFCEWRICKVMNEAWKVLEKADHENPLSDEFIRGAEFIDNNIGKVVR